MTDEYDTLYSNAPKASDPQPDPVPSDVPQDTAYTAQPTHTSAFNQTVFGSAAQQPAAPETPAAPEAAFTPEAAAPEAAYTPEPAAPEAAYAPEAAAPEAAGTPEPAPEAPQTDTETVHAEPAPEYASSGSYYGAYRNVPPYGQQTAPTGSAYTPPPYGSASQPAYGTRPTYGAPPAYGTQQPYGSQPTYGAQPPYGGTYPPAGTSGDAEKKGKKGMKVFFRVLIAVIIIGLVFTVVRLATDRPTVQTDDGTTGVTAAVNAPELETKSSPSSNSKTVAGQALTPTQIAAKVRATSVGILVYSGSLKGTSGQGSGVLWKEDSTGTYTYIITCAHVVNGSGYTYSVQTEDSKTYDADLIGADAKTDLAVLRIKASGLSLAEFGDSSALQVGDPVYAIGNPGGTEFFGSFTSGIVSAIDRSVKNTYTMVCIQHTAAINPGNSGGALVNQYGQVVGINSQKIVNTEYEGMGFAIPIKSAQSTINSLASYGYVKDRPRLGITYAEALNYQQYSMIIKIRGLPSGSLVISEISSDSSLAGTEAKTGDMIIKVDGKDMTTPNVLLDKIENGKVGDKMTLTLCRMDNNYQFKEFNVTVTLIEETPQSTQQETTTTQQYFNPYDFFNGDFGSFFGN